MVAPRLVCRSIAGSDRAFVVQCTAAVTWDDDPTAQGEGVDAVADRIATLQPDRIVVLVHGYNNPPPVAEARARRAWDGYFAGGDPKTVFVAFLWPSEGGFGKGAWAVTGLPELAKVLGVVGAVVALLGLVLGRYGLLLALIGGILLGLIGYVVGLRLAAYYRDHYRATEYGVPDLVEAIHALDQALRRRCGEDNAVDLSFVGHSMGAFVVTSAVRVLSDVFHYDMDGMAPEETHERLRRVGRSLRLANLVLVSPDIPVQALVSTRVNFLADSLRRFEGRFLFSNAGDVVLDPVSTTANSPILPLRGDGRNARLGNVAVLPPAGAGLGDFFEEVGPETYDGRLRTPHGPVREVVASGPGKPTVPIAPGVAFVVLDCTGVGNPRLARRNATAFGFGDRLLGLLAYAAGRQDVHSGYFDHPDLVPALYGAAEFGQPTRHAGETLPDWSRRTGVRVLAMRGEAQVARAIGTPLLSGRVRREEERNGTAPESSGVPPQVEEGQG